MGLNNESTQIVAAAFIGTPLALAALGLRLWSRRLQRVSLAFNDYIAIVATVLASATVSLCLAHVFIGATGKHAAEFLFTNPRVLDLYIKFAIAGEVLWAAANTAVKFSILSLYTKIFPGKTFHRVCYAAMAVSVAFFTTVFLEAFLLCEPVQFNWDKTIPNGKCHNQTLAYLVSGIVNLVIDAFIVALPLPKLYHLQIPLAKRFAIGAMFGLGAVICILSLLRIVSIPAWDLTDPTYTGTGITVYSILEPTLGVVNACLPTMRPALGVIFKNGPFSLGQLTFHSTRRSSKASKTRDSHQFEQIKDDMALHNIHVASDHPKGVHPQGNNITISREWNIDHSSPDNKL
ncbi:hypothetical protein F5B22DRAFT_599651 [Xylaria bambusicola]|uniref:uncharacterized protein n=1 Tax=Xylaria bambusicola TaxID=326684 RepID=UPI0020084EEC|nr:uncharacterized protein F5B22DRAFT_599651 [Xylaria bambusicola]KAI0518555.1 hypothetical protein F5B22DRAFT_599651 [Xylaria bambusicola]